MFSIDRKLWNIIHLGLSFMTLFTADYTVTNMQKTLITSIHDDNPEFTVDGYTSLGITYTVFALSLWLGPSMVSLTGPRYGMALAALGYTIYILAFNLEASWAIYAVTIIGGVAGGLLWTAEGKYLVLNSDSNNVSRNVGIFWVFLQSSYFVVFAFISGIGSILLPFKCLLSLGSKKTSQGTSQMEQGGCYGLFVCLLLSLVQILQQCIVSYIFWSKSCNKIQLY